MNQNEGSGAAGLILLIGMIFFFRYLKNRKTSTSSTPHEYSQDQTEPYPYDGAEDIQTYTAPASAIKGVFVVITSGEPQTQMVAMSLSSQVMGKGKYVRVLLCGPGGDLSLKNGKEVILKPLNKSPQMLLNDMMKRGVKIEVCPFYLPNKGLSPADLIEGVTVANPSAVADGLLESDVKLFTF